MDRRTLERLTVDLAEGQWGLLTSAQARQSGVSRVQLARLVDDGVLARLEHGVYGLRGATSVEYLELRAAWLGLDPERMAADRLRNRADGAVVSHASAARLHQLGDLEADRHEFTLPERRQTRRPHIRLHRGVLTADEVTIVAGLPVATPARIVVDLLVDRQDGEHVARVLASAVRTRVIDLDQLAPLLAPFSTRFGLPRGRGDLTLQYLLEVGGVADLVIADHLVSTARVANVDVVQLRRQLEAMGPLSEIERLRRRLEAMGPLAEIERLRHRLDAMSPLSEIERLRHRLDAMGPVSEIERFRRQLDAMSSGSVMSGTHQVTNAADKKSSHSEDERSPDE